VYDGSEFTWRSATLVSAAALPHLVSVQTTVDNVGCAPFFALFLFLFLFLLFSFILDFFGFWF
jgi:hypothetical protein